MNKRISCLLFLLTMTISILFTVLAYLLPLHPYEWTNEPNLSDVIDKDVQIVIIILLIFSTIIIIISYILFCNYVHKKRMFIFIISSIILICNIYKLFTTIFP